MNPKPPPPAGAVLFANAVFGAAALLAICGIGYVLYVSGKYAGRPDWEGGLKTLYMSLFTGMAVLSIGAIWVPRGTRVNLAITAVVALIMTYGFEVFLANSESFSTQRMTSGHKLQFLKHLRNNGIEASPHFVSEVTKAEGLPAADGGRLQPLGGQSGRTTVFCNEGGQWRLQKTDEHGFNNPEGRFATQELDMALVGDSFTEGVCVERADNIAGRLGQYGFKVLNLGRQGAGPLSILASIREYAGFQKPRFVIWNHYEGNDLSDLNGDRRSRILPNYLDENFSQNLRARQREIDEAIEAFLVKLRVAEEEKLRGLEDAGKLPKILKLWHLRSLITVDTNAPSPNEPPRPETVGDTGKYDYPLFRKILSGAKAQVAAWGGTLVFAYLPSPDRFYHPENFDAETAFGRSAVMEIVTSLQIPTVDMREALLKESGPKGAYSSPRGHFNERGYCLTARAIVTEIAARNLIPEAKGRSC